MNFAAVINALLPEITLLIAALATLATGIHREQAVVAMPTNGRRCPISLEGAVTILGIIAAAVCTVYLTDDARPLGAAIAVDSLTRLFRLILLTLAFFAALLQIAHPPARYRGENLALLLFAVIGMSIVIGTEDLLVLFIGLELTAISLYAMVGIAKGNHLAAEAALKYFLFGSVAAAILLFGMSLLYGITGKTSLEAIATAVQSAQLEPILAVAIVMVLFGFGFKIAAVPFHLWAPDVYQGAPPPTTALIASGSKLAGFVILAKMLLFGFAGIEGAAGWGAFQAGWVPVICTIAALSMVVGNIAALAQNSVSRILAYSGIGHAGFILTALAANTKQATTAALFYVSIYAISTLGAFAITAAVRADRGGDRLTDFTGLSNTSPAGALCLVIFLASLAGLPPLAGFLGKFYLFTSALGSTADGMTPPMLWLVIIALSASAVSLYYYLQIIKQAYLLPASDDASAITLPSLTTITVVTLAIILLLLGILPGLLIIPIEAALSN